MTTNETARHVLVISGSTRSASTNTAFCRTAVQCAPPGITVSSFHALASLPHFNPDEDREPLPDSVTGLRAGVAQADGVLFCTPEYAGTLPGSFKNLLDWMVGGTAFTGKPVAWIKIMPDARRGEGAHAALATVLGYIQAEVVPNACRHVPVEREMVGADGLIGDSATRVAIAQVLQAVLES